MTPEREFRIDGHHIIVREGQETVRLPAGTNPYQRLSHVVKGHLGPGDEAIVMVLDAFEVEHVKLPKKKGDAT